MAAQLSGQPTALLNIGTEEALSGSCTFQLMLQALLGNYTADEHEIQLPSLDCK